MPDHSLHLAKPSLAFAKLVATPTETAWSQAYNAGNLFACLSLTTTQPEADTSLHAVGKDIFSALEAEFFTLEDKNLKTIKQALITSLESVPPSITPQLSVAFFKDAVLYLFIAGAGKAVMKRQGKIGVLLEKVPHPVDKDDLVAEKKPIDITTASGYLENNDTLVLQTHQFAQDISDQTVITALDLELPNDIAEALSPQIHEKDDGGQAAIIVVHHGIAKPEPDEPAEEEAPPAKELPTQTITYEEETYTEEIIEEEVSTTPRFSMPKIRLPFTLPTLPALKLAGMQLTHSKKIYLSIAVILVALLIASIFFTKSKQEEAQRKELFVSVYTPAQKNYEEGVALQSLNQNLSQDDFRKAQQTLKANIDKFPKGSAEEKQLTELLAKVEAELTGSASPEAPTVTATEASIGEHEFLNVVKANADGVSFGEDSDAVYMLTSKAVTTIGKTNGTKKEVIKNEDGWTSGKAVAPYQGNIYILDSKEGVLKYVAGGGGYGKRAYFSSDAPNLNTATAMAIDGSVWLLFADGKLLKYTSGVADEFKISGLEKPLAQPTKLFTTRDIENIYILDKGNGRIVKLGKNGLFQSQYAAAIVSQAKDFTVSEKDKKILILSGNKVWELPL